jgi:hypothetical protein
MSKAQSLQIYVQGVRGGNGETKRAGYTQLTVVDGTDFMYSPCNLISVDTFEGRGQTYKQREKAEVFIKFADDNTYWKGTFDELKDLIKKQGKAKPISYNGNKP